MDNTLVRKKIGLRWADFELTKNGLNQAKLLSKKLKQIYNINALYTSSLLRAK